MQPADTRAYLHFDCVNIHTAYQLTTQYIATSRYNNTTSTWIVSACIHHINSQLNTVQPVDRTTPPSLGWCQHSHTISTGKLSTVQPADTTTPTPLGRYHHTHTISTGNSVQCNQPTQQHHLHLDGVTIHTPYHLATHYSATSRHNSTTST